MKNYYEEAEAIFKFTSTKFTNFATISKISLTKVIQTDGLNLKESVLTFVHCNQKEKEIVQAGEPNVLVGLQDEVSAIDRNQPRHDSGRHRHSDSVSAF